MKTRLFVAIIALSFFIKPNESFAQVNIQDSLALVDYYDSTYGLSPWQGQSWDLQSPVSTWTGIDLSNKRVVGIRLWGGGRGILGKFPSSFGNLTALQTIDFLDYQLNPILPESFENLISLTSIKCHAVFGGLFPAALIKVPNLTTIDLEDSYFSNGIPSSIGNMRKLYSLDLENCGLSGPIPTSLNRIDSLKGMAISYCRYTFKELTPFIDDYKASNKVYDFQYSPQSNISIHRYNNKLAVSAGDALDDTFNWYKDSILIATIAGDSTYAPLDTGRYYVAVTNSVATALTLYGDEITLHYIMPDSLISTTHNITGTSPANITQGIFEIAMLQPTAGVNQLTGNVSALVNVDTTVQAFHSQPYVQRHYDITPAINAANAQATVTLYFTQNDFDNYNNYVTVNTLNLPLLPSGGVNNGNVRITQFHGNFAGSSRPENYSNQNVVLIVPASVAWDNANQWWTVTFPVTGFSGFFVNTGNFTLPLKLLEFKGKLVENNVALQWITTNEVFTREFIVEHSIDGNTFTDINNINSRSNQGTGNYNFTDLNPVAGNNFYRLRMIDIDGKFSYSNIIEIKIADAASKLSCYPNPANNISILVFNSASAEKYMIEITDQSGKIVKRINILSIAGINKINIDLHTYPKGIYFIKFAGNKMYHQSLKLDKQ